MTPTENLASPQRARRELVGLILILLGFILVNAIVATRTPVVFVDEPQYCDPAASLHFDGTFTSTMWGQPHDAFWCGNVPLYQAILWVCFKLAGFGLFQARAVNTLLVAAAGLLIWRALRQTALVRESRSRLLTVAMIFSGSVSTLTFRTIRPDATMFFACALVFYACSLTNFGVLRYGMVVLAGMLLPIAGVPMLPYVGMLLLLNLAVYRLANLRLLVAIGTGLCGGIAVLVWFYNHFATVQTFIKIVLPFTGIGAAAGGGGHQTLHDRVFGDALNSENLWTCFFGYPLEFVNQKTLFDWSSAISFGAAALLTLTGWRSISAAGRRFMVFILAVTVIVPPFMHLAGHYRSFYRWMTYLPLAIALPHMLEIHRAAGAQRLWRLVTMAGICLSLFSGVPLRSLVATPHWRARSPAPLEQVAAQVAQPGDIVVADFRTYFALRPRTKLLYAYGLTARGDFTNTVDLPTNDITLLCLFPDALATVTNKIGGHWKKIPLDDVPGSAALAQTRYAVDFYRREPAGGH